MHIGYLVTVSVLSVATSSNTVVADCRSRHRCSGVGGRSVNGVLIDVTLALRWTSMTLIYNDTERLGVDIDALVVSLYEEGMRTMAVANTDPTVIPRGTLSAMVMSRNYLIIGTRAFSDQVLGQVSRLPHVKALDLFETEWLLVTEADAVLTVVPVVAPFRNVAVVASSSTGELSLWTLRHGPHVNHLDIVTSFSKPALPDLTRHDILPNPAHGLTARTLRVVAKEISFSLFKTQINGTYIYQGILMDVLEELSVRLNFSYTVIPPTDDSWGQKLDNGQWDGPIGMLTRNEADLALGTFSLTPSRSEVADPSTPIWYDRAYIVYKTKDISHKDPWAFFLQPFNSSVYAVLGGCAALVLLLLLLLEGCQRRLDNQQGIHSRASVVLGKVVDRLEVLLVGVLNRPCSLETGSRAGRVVMITWLLLGVLLTSVYSSQLTSSLAVSDKPSPLKSLSQLLQQDAYTWGVSGGTAQESILKNSKNKEFQTFYKKLEEFSRADPTVLAKNYDVHKAKVFRGDYAYFSGSSEQLYTWAAESCGVVDIPQTFFVFTICLYLQKDSPYTRLISNEINRMVDSGLMDHWWRVWAPEKRRCGVDEEGANRVIGLADTLGAFCLAAAGLGVATVVLACERRFCFSQSETRILAS